MCQIGDVLLKWLAFLSLFASFIRLERSIAHREIFDKSKCCGPDITTARIDQLFHFLHEHGATRERYILKDESVIAYGTRRPIHRKSGVALETMQRLSEGKSVLKETAQKIADAAGRSLSDCFSKVIEESRLDSGTVARVRTALSPIFSTAVKKEMLAKNPVMNATTPKDEPEEQPYLNAEDCKTILQNIDDFLNPQLPRVIKTLLYTGMRSGELMALHWQEVDFDSGMITSTTLTGNTSCPRPKQKAVTE